MGASVSVALCTHNGSRYIGAQLASILSQTVPVSELVLGDDASDDDTVAIATRLANDAGLPIRVLRSQEPLGVAKNFERTILACVGEFVALSDQDDVWHANRVARALEAFERRPALALVSGDATLVDADGEAIGATLFRALGVTPADVSSIENGHAYELYSKRNLVTGATTMIRRSLGDRAAPFPAAWVHDEWLAIVASARDEAGVIAEPLIDYRQHGGNQIGVVQLSQLGKLRRMLDPGASRSRRLLLRASELAARIGDIDGVPPERVEAAREKLAHERVRSALSVRRALRLIPVTRELRTGRYHRFGRGPADAVRDLVQPLTDSEQQRRAGVNYS